MKHFQLPLIVILLVIAGCQNQRPPSKVPSPGPHLEVASSITKEVAASLPRRAEAIDTHLNQINQKLPIEWQTEISMEVTNIKVETAGMRSDATRLDEGVVQIASARVAGDAQAKAIERLTEENRKLREEQKNGLNKIMGLMIVASIACIGIAAVLIYLKNPWGIALGVGAVVTLGAAILIREYAVWFAAGAGILILGACGFFVRKIYIERRATMELVKTTEITKRFLPPDARKMIFGGETPAATKIQSDTTQKMVVEAREEISNDIALTPAMIEPDPMAMPPQ